MKKYLIILLSLFFIGCTHSIFYDPLGNCRNRAIFCALEAKENYETVVIISGSTNNSSTIYHAQAKVKKDGEWQWLTMKGEYCYISNQDNFYPLNEWEIKDFVQYISAFKKK